MSRLWPIVRGAVRVGVAPFALPALLVVAVVERGRTMRRRRRRARPRLLWGPTPLISMKYWSAAMRALGYESLTFAHGVYAINSREDFDVVREEFLGSGLAWEAVKDFVVFVWALQRADVFLTFLDGGLLRFTALRRLEGPLLRLAGKRLIVSPYGRDIAVPGYLGPVEHALLEDYPDIETDAAATRRRVLYFCRWADLVIRNHQYGFLPRADVVWPTQMAVDTELWKGNGEVSRADGRTGEVVVVHAPNHRHVKGTERLLRAIDGLQAAGLRVRLEVIERRPNEEVRAAVQRCDIVAEQFLAGFGIFAIEGASAGKPVISALGWIPEEVRNSPMMQECPFVDVDREPLQEALRALVCDPDRREALGREGREFTLRHCSYAAAGRIWTALIDHVWWGAPLPPDLLPRGQV